MGRAKAAMMESWDRGYDFIGEKHVCAECVEDSSVAAFIEEHVENNACSYCGRKSEDRLIAASVDDVLALVVESIRTEWTDPANELAYETREGGYQGELYDTYDLFEGEALFTYQEDLLDDINAAIINRVWCRKNYYQQQREDALAFGWSEFVEQTKHHTRYLFLIAPDPDAMYRGSEETSPAKMLETIGQVILDVGITRQLPTGTRFVRARVHEPGKLYESAAELGPPPREFVKYPNRMSPAGIVMFYGAQDEETALAETYDDSNQGPLEATLAVFETLRDLNVIDLTDLPPVPSLFDEEQRHLRSVIVFLHDFVEDLTKPVKKNGSEHIEYVPTQIVTEYFRHVLTTEDEEPIHGVLYNSSRRPGGVCCVLFCDSNHCCDQVVGTVSETEYWLAKHAVVQRVVLE